MHPSQPSQFDGSQPLSQHALSQTSELSFGGGAALHGASMTALHSAKADAASSMNGSSIHDNDLNASERQEDPDDDDDGDDSQALLKVCKLCLLLQECGVGMWVGAPPTPHSCKHFGKLFHCTSHPTFISASFSIAPPTPHQFMLNGLVP
jgi:hypothetical protein